MYRVGINSREYKTYEVYNNYDLSLMEGITINPFESKLFNQDAFSMDDDGNIMLEHSIVRTCKQIPCVLLLKGNKTFGKHRDKFYYKCVPDDKRLPVFLVQYRFKKGIGFSKDMKDKFVVIKFKNWDEKHPLGELTETLGDVDELSAFYEYMLYRKSLQSSISDFTKHTLKKLKENTEDEYIEKIFNKYEGIKDLRDRTIYTIDPKNSKDFDDAFSLVSSDEAKTVSIYISNVYYWFDILDLWGAFSNRVCTIYLPDKKRPMLPNVLSDSLCSLNENCNRFAFVMDIVIKDGKIVETKYYNGLIRVSKNFRYEEKSLLESQDYNEIFEVVKEVNKSNKIMSNIEDSHDVISYLMMYMNSNTAKEMIKYKIGIFRSFKLDTDQEFPDDLDNEVKKYITYSKSNGGLYELYSDSVRTHDIIKMSEYTNITSPIRRLVDLLNMIMMMEKMGCVLSLNTKNFLDEWKKKIDYINVCDRSVKRVQMDCSMLQMFYDNEDMRDKDYRGCMYDKMERGDGLFQYNVYIPELKMFNRYISRIEYDNYSTHEYKLFLFKNEDNFRQKVRLVKI